MGVTNFLCQALHSEYEDILNVIWLIKSTKWLIEKLRKCG